MSNYVLKLFLVIVLQGEMEACYKNEAANVFNVDLKKKCVWLK